MTSPARFVSLLLAIAIVPVTACGHGRGAGQAPVGGLTPRLAAPPPGSGAISGVVVDGVTGAPVPGAVIMLAGIVGISVPTSSSPGASPTRQVTDAKGRFAFVNLPAAPNFTLTANKPGYIAGSYGQQKSLADGM